MDKALQILALARKAGCAELGEEPVGAAARAGKAHLVVIAADASDHTWRRGKSFVAGTEQQCIRVEHSKDAMGQVIGRTSLAMAAITDPALALSLVQSLERQYPDALAVLTQRVQKDKQRRMEAKAHQKNKKMGKKK